MLSVADREESAAPPWAGLLIAVAIGTLAYANLATLAGNVGAWLGLEPGSALGEALQFFLYEVPKILLLLYGIVFLVGVAQSFFPPARTKALLVRPAGRGRQHHGRVPRYRDPVLLLLSGPPVHRLPVRGGSPRRHLLLPSIGTHG